MNPRPTGSNAPTDLNPRRDPPLDFADRPYGELTAADYEELGFLCGLEVHQQLATRVDSWERSLQELGPLSAMVASGAQTAPRGGACGASVCTFF